MNTEERKNFVKKKKLPINLAWALVAMADRINEGQYIKFAEMDQETATVKTRPNRDIIRDQIALGLVNLTKEDHDFGNLMADHFQGIVFNAIGRQLNDFDQKIMNLIVQEEVDVNLGMAYLACMAVRYRRELVKEHKQESMLRIGSTSIHQGSIGQHLRINVTVINKYEGKAFPGSVVRATDGTNLYFWSSSKFVDMWPDAPEQFPVVGVVKAHGQDREGIMETRLTRVKIAL